MRLVLVLALAAAGAAQVEEPGFLVDALRMPRYRASWEKLYKIVQPTPDWLVNFEKNFDGASGGMKGVTVGGKPYKLSFVCKPEDCVGHKFAVLFDADGSHAFGALGGGGEPPAFFGAPSAPEQEALSAGLQPPAK